MQKGEICPAAQARLDKIAGEIFDFVVEYKRAHDGMSPSLREIQERLGAPSHNVVYRCLRRLVADGRIVMHEKGAARGIIVVGGAWVFGGVGSV
jgi:SOS-response transcriptional repressor LexA